MKVEIDKAALQEIRDVLEDFPAAAKKVTNRAINKTLTGIRTDATDAVSNEITPKKTVIRDTFNIIKATTVDDRALIYSKGGPLPLVHFSARATKAGVTAQIDKADPRVLWPGAFIATVRSAHQAAEGLVGHTGVFSRQKPPYKTKASTTLPWKQFPEQYRLPIKEMYGPSVPSILERDGVMTEVLKKADVRLQTNVEHELEYEISRMRDQGVIP